MTSTEQNRTVDVLLATDSDIMKLVVPDAFERRGITVEIAETPKIAIQKIRGDTRYKMVRIIFHSKDNYYPSEQVVKAAVEAEIEHIFYENYEGIHPSTLYLVEQDRVIHPPYSSAIAESMMAMIEELLGKQSVETAGEPEA